MTSLDSLSDTESDTDDLPFWQLSLPYMYLTDNQHLWTSVIFQMTTIPHEVWRDRWLV